MDKKYLTTIDFSKQSDTRDSDYRKEYVEYPVTNGQVLVEGKVVKTPDQATIDNLLQSIIGTHLLPLTPFSAKKRKGKKLYEYARAGEPIFIESPMELIGYNIHAYTFPLLTLELHV